MGWPFVKRRMQGELGPGWEAKFGSFERTAAHAASLGQVHRAVLRDGTAVAAKLQYPDMSSAVEADLKQLRLIFAIYRRYDKAIDPENIHAEIAERLREELDYRREARNMRLYGTMLKDEAHVSMPVPVEALSTDRLLTMTWLDGVPLMSLAQTAPVERRNAVAQAMFRAWYVPFYGYGVIHGDPHLGNYSIRPDDGVNLLDFGSIRVFPPAFVKAVIDLYHALERGDRDLAVHAYEAWGFNNLSTEMIDVLNRWAGFLYGPLLDDKVRRIQEVEGGSRFGAEVAADVHEQLRKLGGVKPPREFVMVDRAAVGLGSVFMHLKAEVNWHRLFNELIADFDIATLEKRQSKALMAVGLEPQQGQLTP
jgi:predicted unusual protein kinase regulating ubiquinone biosynthesis (AarF/ABC1/UbiB family)